jgi:archaellum component FlaC
VTEKDANPADQIRHLRELIDALERRVPMIERLGEVQIARDAELLKEKALKRIAELGQ